MTSLTDAVRCAATPREATTAPVWTVMMSCRQGMESLPRVWLLRVSRWEREEREEGES